MNFRARFHRTGEPAEVLELESFQPPARELESSQVRVRTRFTPVNPADINFIQGRYGKQPELPAVPGMEGAGEVIESEDPGLTPGQPVLLPSGPGLWQSEHLLSSQELISLPAHIDLRQAAMLRVNPPTAWLLLNDFVKLQPGDWVIQNAANSAVGQAVAQWSGQMGLRTINLLRDPARWPGEPDAVVLADDQDAEAKVREVLRGQPLRLALNAVGGESATRMAGMLADRGVMVTYGAMSLRSIKIPNRFLIFQNLEFRGFWLSRWMREHSQAECRKLLEQQAAGAAQGWLRMPVDTVYPVQEIIPAIEHAARGGRQGKILIDWST